MVKRSGNASRQYTIKVLFCVSFDPNVTAWPLSSDIKHDHYGIAHVPILLTKCCVCINFVNPDTI